MLTDSLRDKAQNARRGQQKKIKRIAVRLGDVYNNSTLGENAHIFINNSNGSNAINHINCAPLPIQEAQVSAYPLEKSPASFNPYAVLKTKNVRN